MKQEKTKREVIEQLRALGVTEGGVLVVHTSFRAVRPVEGGPDGLIDALEEVLGDEGTLVMPTMTAGTSVFDPRVTPTLDMGVVAETFWRRPGVSRSTHPGASFAAKGKQAAVICAQQPLSPPHGLDSPIGRVYALNGEVLLLGVTHGENTSLHLAEAMANVPYSIEHPCVVEVDGEARTVMIPETDHCCENFSKMDSWLRSAQIQREGDVGYAAARLCSAKALVDLAIERLREEPLWFLCAPDSGCEECALAHASISGSVQQTQGSD